MNSKLFFSAAALVLSSMLVACGDSSNLPPSAQTPPGPALVDGTDVPVAATQSADEAMAFVRQVVAMMGDNLLPLILGDAMLATSDTAEPAADI
jgi:hypothetical protein